jgi:hypothetical protein
LKRLKEEYDRFIAGQEEAEARARAESLKALQDFHAHRMQVEEINRATRLDLIKRLEDAETFTHKEAFDSRLLVEKEAFERQRVFLLKQLEVAKELGAAPKVIREIVQAIEIYNAEANRFNESIAPRSKEAVDADTDAREKNFLALSKQIDALKLLVKMDVPTFKPGVAAPAPIQSVSIFGDMKAAAKADVTEILSQGQILYDSMKGMFEGLAESGGQMVDAFLLGGDLSAAAFGKMAKAAIASVASQAIVHAIFEEAMGLASLWLNPAEAATHFLAAKTFALVGVAAAGLSLAIPGGRGGASSGAAGAALSSGAGSSQGGAPNNQSFNYGNPNSPSSSVAQQGSGNFFRDQRNTMDRIAASLDRIQAMPHGQALAIGASENPGAVGQAVLDHSASDHSFGTTLTYQWNAGRA